uniref:Large ribosomal subunit protein eL6 n=1 Tax=Schistosoma japonicum TaxID=6182 RepID=C1LAT8_SCHJA|nr:putative 60S ribosomal protein L6 [Schistosoma japonicum]
MAKVKCIVRRKLVSAKRQYHHLKFIANVNKKLKKAGKDPLTGLRTPKTKEALVKPKTRFPRSYVTQQGKRKLRLRRAKCFSNHVRKIRSSIQPGTVLILLAGPHKGKRVIFLKALKSGLLLVTGPFKYNGVPLRRVNQCYVIATSTRIDISKFDVPKHIDDEYFRRVDLKESKTDAGKLFSTETKKYTVSDIRKEDQKLVDNQIRAAIKSHPDSKILHAYLRSLFSLGKRDYPHKMIF